MREADLTSSNHTNITSQSHSQENAHSPQDDGVSPKGNYSLRKRLRNLTAKVLHILHLCNMGAFFYLCISARAYRARVLLCSRSQLGWLREFMMAVACQVSIHCQVPTHDHFNGRRHLPRNTRRTCVSHPMWTIRHNGLPP